MPIQQNHKLVLTVIVSVFIHLLLFSLLYMSKQTKKTPTNNIVKPIPITAKLYYYTPPVAALIEEAPQVEPETKTMPEQVPVEVLKEVKKEPEVSEEATPIEQPQQDVAQRSITPPPAETQPAESAVHNQYNQAVQDVVQSQLNGYQQGKLDNLAAQAAAEYRKQLTSPTLLTKPRDPFVTEEEKLMQKVTTSVDCSSATNQTLAVVMGIMGGAVRCSEPPPFDSFIQKRLNKTALLPALEQ